MRLQLVLLVGVTLAFSVYTAFVIEAHGYTGFIQLALAEAWGGQMFVDLVIALVLFSVWMQRDARSHGIPAWPYFGLMATTGSIGALAYLIHRAARLAFGAPVGRA